MSSSPPLNKKEPSTLSTEQLLRIERNKRLAKERLLAKRDRRLHSVLRKSQQSETDLPEKKCRTDPLLSASLDVRQPSNVSTQSSRGSNFISDCSRHQPTLQCAQQFEPVMAIPSYPAGHCTKNRHLPDTRPPALIKKLPHEHFTPSRHRVMANFAIILKDRFKVEVSYDAHVIALFKNIGSKSYDAKTSTWNFSIRDYTCLVESMKKDCPSVQLNLIPKPVVSLLQLFLHSAQLKNMSSVRDISECQSGHQGKFGQTSSMEWTSIDSVLTGTLMQFQKDGVRYCIQRGGRALIADDMGLGKTLQAIAVMSYYRTDWPLLVVCPSSVRLTWAEAFKRWVPSLQKEKMNVILSAQDSSLSGHLVNIISYDLAVKMEKQLREQRFRAVIADESHFLKNNKTARCKAVAPIVKNAKRALLLSGTPALSRPIELFTQISMLDRNFQSISFAQFGIRYCNGFKNNYGWNFGGASNMLELQLYMEESFMIRRMKSEVLDQLPTKRRQMVLLDPAATSTKGKEWNEMKKELDRAGTLKGLDRKNAVLPLYEKTGRLKIPAIKMYILDILEGRRKMLVFGHHRVVLDSVCKLLNEKDCKHIRIDGRTPPEVRQTLCDQFQHDEECLVAVLSITTANAGLTLTSASTVVFAELFWNPGILVQAEDRAYRIGQHNSVNVHYLVAGGTADDFIWPLIQVKLDVLCQAGLAKADFSKADSTSIKHERNQMSLFDCIAGDLLEDARTSIGEEGETSCVSTEESSKPTAKYIDTSNWFDNLTDEDFNGMDNIC